MNLFKKIALVIIVTFAASCLIFIGFPTPSQVPATPGLAPYTGSVREYIDPATGMRYLLFGSSAHPVAAPITSETQR